MSQLSDSDLARLHHTLATKRDELVAAQRTSAREGRGVVERESEDGDVAEGIIEQDAALRLAAFDASLLTDVEHALAKLDAGTYGVSEDSGAPIPLERLEVVPWARRTAQEEERRARS